MKIWGVNYGISTTGKIEMDFFSTTQKKSLCHIHVARDMSSEREFRCTVVCMSQFYCGNEVKLGHKVQTNKL